MLKESIPCSMQTKIGSIPIFQLEDDANRYLTMLEDVSEYPSMRVVEMEDHVIIDACQQRGQKFSIITPDDFIIPPDNLE